MKNMKQCALCGSEPEEIRGGWYCSGRTCALKVAGQTAEQWNTRAVPELPDTPQDRDFIGPGERAYMVHQLREARSTALTHLARMNDMVAVDMSLHPRRDSRGDWSRATRRYYRSSRLLRYWSKRIREGAL